VKIKFIVLVFILISQNSLFAQTDTSNTEIESITTEEFQIPLDPPEKIHPFSIRISAGVPNPVSSELFRKSMIGIYEFNILAATRIGNYFYAGLGFNNSLLSLSNRTKYSAKTKMQSYGVFGRIGYDYYHSNKVFSSFFINAGYKKGFYTGILNLDKKPQNPNFEMAFFQPGYSINFFSEERLTLGFYIAGQMMFWKYNPEQLNLSDSGIEITKYKNESNTGFWIIGLEMYIGLGKQKK
jgi:hypothetical protein